MKYFDIAAFYRTLMGLSIGMIVCAVISWLVGCTSVKYVDRVKTEYTHKTDSFFQRDSIFLHDSISMYFKGDTVYKEKYQILWREKARESVRRDTVLKQDSIQVPVYVEHRKTFFESFLEKTGIVSLISLLTLIIFFALRLYLKKG